MKTTLLKTNSTSSKVLKLISILFIVVLNASNISAQTAAKNSGNTNILIPTVHYQQKAKSVNVSSVIIYSVLAAKNFPIIQGVESVLLDAKVESEDFNYDTVFHKANSAANKVTENTMLALHYKTQKNTNS